jgi:mannose-6-phosphate isomerase-like protein (cupin superfamily)
MSGSANPSPTIRIRPASDAPATPLGEAGNQRVLLGGPRNDASPLLMGITLVRPGHTSLLIEHDSAEICYVLSGTGSMITDTSEHPFGPGDAIVIEQGCWHAIFAAQDVVEMLYVFPSVLAPVTRERRSARTQ